MIIHVSLTTLSTFLTITVYAVIIGCVITNYRNILLHKLTTTTSIAFQAIFNIFDWICEKVPFIDTFYMLPNKILQNVAKCYTLIFWPIVYLHMTNHCPKSQGCTPSESIFTTGKLEFKKSQILCVKRYLSQIRSHTLYCFFFWEYISYGTFPV